MAATFITPELFTFFRSLARNNDRAWFEKTYADHEKVAIKIGMYKK